MASKLTETDIKEVTRQSDVRSKILRDNYTNLKNKTNEIIDEIAAIAVGTTNAETTAARPYHTSLKNRLDSIESGKEDVNGRINYLKTGGAVTINADTAKVDIAAGQAKVGGIDVKWAASTSATISAAAASNHRIDVVAVQSDSTLTVVTGAESLKGSTNPVFPSISSTQDSLAALYVDDTGSVDLTSNIYQLKDDTSYPNYYIKQATTLNQGKYVFNNLILDAAITIDCTSTTGLKNLQRENVIINCVGNIYSTASGDIGIAGTHVITINGKNGVTPSDFNGGAAGAVGILNNIVTSLATSKGGDGYGGFFGGAGAEGGGGGGGGASIVVAGGAGGDGGDTGAAVSLEDEPGGTASTDIAPFLLIKAYNMDFSGDIINDGDNGGNGIDGNDATAAASSGGAGGNAAGLTVLLAKNDITVNAGSTISADGGTGGNGGSTSIGTDYNAGGGGGGGGAGGLVLARSKSYTNNGTVQANAGGAGTGGSASGGGLGNAAGSAGTAGTAGLVDQELYDSTDHTDFTNLYYPLNILGLEL